MLSVVSFNIENLVPALPTMRRPRSGSVLTPPADLTEILLRVGEPDVLCLQEIRVRPQDDRLIAEMEHALPGYICHYALCRDRKNVTFRGGRAHGVATYVRSGLEARAVPQPAWDGEGRVVAIEFPSRQLLLANVYAVNGTDRPYFDHDLGRQEGDRHAFKRRFQAHLLQYLQAYRAKGYELVLMGDWNISRTVLDVHPRLRTEAPHALARAMFNETFMPALDVVDVFRERHPEAREFTWFNKATPAGRLDAARVDFALVSGSLMDRVLDVHIGEQRFHSDHAPIHLKLRMG